MEKLDQEQQCDVKFCRNEYDLKLEGKIKLCSVHWSQHCDGVKLAVKGEELNQQRLK